MITILQFEQRIAKSGLPQISAPVASAGITTARDRHLMSMAAMGPTIIMARLPNKLLPPLSSSRSRLYLQTSCPTEPVRQLAVAPATMAALTNQDIAILYWRAREQRLPPALTAQDVHNLR